MKNIFIALSIGIILYSCDQSSPKTDTINYNKLTAQRNYWDSIPGKVKVREKWRPYRYYLNEELYSGKVTDTFSSGRPKLIGEFKDGYAVGPWKYYQENDSLEQIGSFDSGYVTGEWRFYDVKGNEETRVIYKRNGRNVTADSLLKVYHDGSRKEWLKDKIVCTYPNGQKKSEMSIDGSSGMLWDEHGEILSDMKDFILLDHYTKSKTFFIAKGKNKIAFDALLSRYNWTQEQKDHFKTANKVRVEASGRLLSTSSYGFEVTLE